jgi:LPS-assembly lipoprotein
MRRATMPTPQPVAALGLRTLVGQRAVFGRRTVLLSASAFGLSALAGCGFKLRGSQDFAFKTIATTFAETSLLGQEFRRTMEFNDGARVLTGAKSLDEAQVVLQITNDVREKTVVGVNSSGGVREFALRVRLKFILRTPQGKELIPETELLLQRDVSFNETAVLSKEAEEGLLYANMQTDVVQQLLRRLAAVKSL